MYLSDLTSGGGSDGSGVSRASTVLARVEILLRPGRADSRRLTRRDGGGADDRAGELESMLAVSEGEERVRASLVEDKNAQWTSREHQAMKAMHMMMDVVAVVNRWGLFLGQSVVKRAKPLETLSLAAGRRVSPYFCRDAPFCLSGLSRPVGTD